MRLFVGDDWAEDHHDIELIDSSGRRLAKARLPEGAAGMARLHSMIGDQLGEDAEDAEVLVGIETDRGPWVAALVAAGYTVLAVNPLQAARFRDRLGVSGANSDAGDAHVLADMVRTHAHELRPVAGDSALAEAIQVVARTHKTLIWERTRHTQRLRHALRDYFPAALVAFDDLDAADTLELLAKAPTPSQAARLTLAQISAALKRARRRNVAEKAAAIQAALRSEQLGQPEVVAAAYAASVQALIAVLTVLNTQVKAMQGQVEVHFGRHPAAEIILSQPGLGPVLGARVLAEFGDDPDRYATAKARKNYADTSPITARPARRRSPWPGSSTTTGSSTPSPRKRSTRCCDPREHAPTTTGSVPAAPVTTLPCANSPTDSSASSTAASKPAPSTTRRPPGRITSTRLRLDIQTPGMSFSRSGRRRGPRRERIERETIGRVGPRRPSGQWQAGAVGQQS